jgi:hypothetical protein
MIDDMSETIARDDHAMFDTRFASSVSSHF